MLKKTLYHCIPISYPRTATLKEFWLITLQKTDRLDSNSLFLGQVVSLLSSNLWWETIKSLFPPQTDLSLQSNNYKVQSVCRGSMDTSNSGPLISGFSFEKQEEDEEERGCGQDLNMFVTILFGG